MNKSLRLIIVLCGLSYAMAWGQAVSLQELVNKKQFNSVITLATAFTAKDSADYSAMSAVAQAYEGLLKFREAYGVYDFCLKLDTANLDALNALARVAGSLGRTADSEAYYQRVLTADSMNFYANYQLARLYHQAGDYEKAIGQYTILRDMEPEVINPTLYSNIADCYTRMDAYPAAALCYFQAYNANRENPGLGSSLINTLLRLGGDYISQALSICDTALYYNPGNRRLTRDKGLALYMSKRFADADTLYTKLLAEGDSSYLTLKYGGASRFYAGRFYDCVEQLEAAYEKDTTSVEVNLLLGAALGKTYDRKRAYVLFDQAEEAMKPPLSLNRLLVNARFETLCVDGRRAEAVQLLYGVWKQEPQRIELLYKLSMLYSNGDQEYFYESDANRQRALFLKYTYLDAYLKTGKSTKGYGSYLPFLESMRDFAFFKGVDKLPIIAPDGKKSVLPVADLQRIIKLLPEIPQEEKDLYDRQKEVLKQRVIFGAGKKNSP